MKFVNKNYYEILDIEPAATDEDIKRAYRLVRGTWKPDSIAVYSLYTPEENRAIAHRIEEAFQVLSNRDRRASYDQYLRDVDRIPSDIRTPEAFWDFVHGIAPPDVSEEMLEDVTDLLSDSVAEEMAEQEVLEAAVGAEARAIERPIDARGGVDSFTENPRAKASVSADNAPGLRRPRPPVTAPVTRPALTTGRMVIPPAPAAPPLVRPPVTDSVPPAAAKTPLPAPAAPSRPSVPSRAPEKGARPAVTPVKPVSPSRPGPSESVSSQHSAGSVRRPSEMVSASGWSRSYAQPIRNRTPLPDRPIPPGLLAEAEAEYGPGGTFLKAVREYKGISLSDIADRTKIPLHYLKAIECDNFSDLPAPVYVEGFVSQMVRLLKLDVPSVTRAYMDRFLQWTPEAPVEPDRTDDE